MMRFPLVRTLVVAGLVLGLLGARADASEDGPRAPCGGAPAPSYTDPGAAPNVQAWSSGTKRARDWVPPACTGWSAPGFNVMVAVAGSFRHEGSVDDLLTRIGAVSSLKGIRYWSTTEKSWRSLVTEAYALSNIDPEQKCPDFTAAQMTKGRSIYFSQSDNRSTGRTLYRLRTREREPDRLVIDSENVTAMKMMLITVFDAGEMQSAYFLERRSPGVWGFYSLSRVRAGSSLISSGNEASYINRAVAYYRHIAGIPTDLNPPAAR